MDLVTGPLCEVMMDPCMKSLCKEGSTCVGTEDGGFTCHCPENMEGEFCENGKPITVTIFSTSGKQNAISLIHIKFCC